MSPSGGWGRDLKVPIIEGLMRDSRADLKESDTSKMVVSTPQYGDTYKIGSDWDNNGSQGLEVCRHCSHAQIQNRMVSIASSPTEHSTTKEVVLEEETPPRRQTICGLRPVAFYAVFILSLLLIIGGVIGGVLGTKALRPATLAPASTASSNPPVSPVNTTSDAKAVK